jgi:hypothetical protein
MPDVSLSVISNGDSADATPVNNNFQEIQAALNALDADNWASGAVFAPSKLTQEGASTGQALVWSGSAWAPDTIDPDQIGQGGAATGQILGWSGSAWAPTAIQQLLGSVTYDPTTVTTPSTSSTTGADIDATNLSLTVTVPASGKILTVFSFVPTSSNVTSLFLGLRESTTNIAYAKLKGVANTQTERTALPLLVTGLSAGSHTYKMAFKAQSAIAVGIYYGTQATPAVADPGACNMTIFGVA